MSAYSRVTTDSSTPEIQFKVIIIGDSGIGKTSLLLRYVDDTFSPSFSMSTIGVDFRFKTIMNEKLTANKLVKLQLWDTSGQEKFKTICMNYFRNAHCVLLCADLTDPSSWENLSKWNAEIERFNPNGVLGFVVGTKADMVARRLVSREQAEQFAKTLGFPYIETSSKDGTCVDDAFEQLIPKLLAKRRIQDEKFDRTRNSTINLGKSKPVNNNSWFSSYCNIV